MKKRRFFSAAAGLLTTALILTAACLPGVAAGADTVARITVADAAFDRETACVRDVPMGSIAADAVRQAAGADIAVIPCGDFSDTDVGVKKFSRADAAALFSADREIAVMEITAARLYDLLETALSAVTLDPETKRLDTAASVSDGFLQISGFELVYDSAAPAGSRVYSLTVGGQTLDRDSGTALTLACGLGALQGLPDGGEPLSMRYSEALLAYLAENPLISEYDSGRIRPIGNADNSILAALPGPVLAILLAVLLCAGIIVTRVRKKQLFDDGGRYFRPKYSMMK